MKINYNFFKNKRVLINGANGYIGNQILENLKTTGCKITTISKRRYKYDYKINNIYFHKNRLPKIKDKFDIIYLCGANTSLKENEIYQSNLIREYLFFLQHLLSEIAHQKSLKTRVVFLSSATIFGLKSINTNNFSKPKPITPYDLNKVIFEDFLSHFSLIHNLQIVILRLTNVYGYSKVTSSKSDRGFINNTIYKFINKEEVTIYDNGKYYRNFIDVEDVLNALLISAYNKNVVNRKYIIGNSKNYKIISFINKIKKFFEKKHNIKINLKFIKSPKNIDLINLRNFKNFDKTFSIDTGWHCRNSVTNTLNKFIRH